MKRRRDLHSDAKWKGRSSSCTQTVLHERIQGITALIFLCTWSGKYKFNNFDTSKLYF